MPGLVLPGDPVGLSLPDRPGPSDLSPRDGVLLSSWGLFLFLAPWACGFRTTYSPSSRPLLIWTCVSSIRPTSTSRGTTPFGVLTKQSGLPPLSTGLVTYWIGTAST